MPNTVDSALSRMVDRARRPAIRWGILGPDLAPVPTTSPRPADSPAPALVPAPAPVVSPAPLASPAASPAPTASPAQQRPALSPASPTRSRDGETPLIASLPSRPRHKLTPPPFAPPIALTPPAAGATSTPNAPSIPNTPATANTPARADAPLTANAPPIVGVQAPPTAAPLPGTSAKLGTAELPPSTRAVTTASAEVVALIASERVPTSAAPESEVPSDRQAESLESEPDAALPYAASVSPWTGSEVELSDEPAGVASAVPPPESPRGRHRTYDHERDEAAAPTVQIGQISVITPAAAAPAGADPLGSLASRRQGRSRHSRGSAP